MVGLVGIGVAIPAGGEEQCCVDLLEEEPAVPSAREMLRIIARDPVAQALFFILSMRLFCEHVLGTGPFDWCFRHNQADPSWAGARRVCEFRTRALPNRPPLIRITPDSDGVHYFFA